MTNQELVYYDRLESDDLKTLRALGVDMIHLELRSGTSMDATPIAQDLKHGRDRTQFFVQARERVESFGMALNTVFMSCWPEIPLGLQDKDEKIHAWCEMLKSLGRAGIPTLGWNFKPMGNFRTSPEIGRGGASYKVFDLDEFRRTPDAFMQGRTRPHVEVTEDEMWSRLEEFLRAVIPVAEKANVRMALHPDDPPVPEALAGVAQICSTPQQFRRILDIYPSSHHQLLFCQGCWAEHLGVPAIYDAIAEFASSGRIAWVHFRNVREKLPRFTEVFIDEGDVDMERAMKTYRDNGFDGPFMLDHTPVFGPGSGPPEHYNFMPWIGRAYAIGYIRALLQSVYGRG